MSAYSDDILVLWLTFIEGVATAEEWKELCRKMPKIKKAFDKLVYVSNDREQRILADQRHRAILDYNSDLFDAKEEGFEEGLEEGLEKGIKKGIKKGKDEGKWEEKMAVAKNLLVLGIDIPVIIQATGLCEEQILQLQAEMSQVAVAPTRES